MDNDYGIWNPDSHQIKEDNKRIGFPLDSHIDYDKDGNPVFDRAIASAPLRTLFKGLLTDGVSPDASRIDADITSDSFKVSAGEEMSVVVNKGFAICGGCLKYNEASETLPISAATDKARIDTVVLRLDDNDSVRSCELYVVEGVPGTTPKRPDLTRNGSKWEIGLADVYVTANSTQISNSKITDTRLESERCGIISAIDSIDTSRFFAQIEADLEYFKDHYEKDFSDWSAEQQTEFESWSDGEEEIFANWSSEMREEYETWSDRQKADFIVWFNNLQVILDENVAARLTAEVEALKSKDTEIEGQISDLSDDVDERISEVEQKIEGGIPTKTSDLENDGNGRPNRSGLVPSWFKFNYANVAYIDAKPNLSPESSLEVGEACEHLDFALRKYDIVNVYCNKYGVSPKKIEVDTSSKITTNISAFFDPADVSEGDVEVLFEIIFVDATNIN